MQNCNYAVVWKKTGSTLNLKVNNFIIISCKKATYLLSKKEERALSLSEAIKLQLHLFICRFCRLFELQSKLICNNAHHTHEHHPAVLSDAAKEKIVLLLKGDPE